MIDPWNLSGWAVALFLWTLPIAVFLIAFAIGFSAELIGVHSGMLFGNYSYGNNLGLKLAEVPLIIGINWGVLAVTSASITETL